jgi:hypothetical protein
MRINLRAALTVLIGALTGLLLVAAPASARPVADHPGASPHTAMSGTPFLVPGGVYTIHNASGKCLEIENSAIGNGAAAQQWDCLGQAGMYWQVYENPQYSGIFRFVNNNSGRCLEIEGSSYNNGARAQQWDCVGQAGANWHFPTSASDNTWILNNSGKCLEIENSSYNNGARAQQWDCVNQHGAIWTLVYCDPTTGYAACTKPTGLAATAPAAVALAGDRPSLG